MSKRKSWEERKRRRLERIVSEFEIIPYRKLPSTHRARGYVSPLDHLCAMDPKSKKIYGLAVHRGDLFPMYGWIWPEIKPWEIPAFELLFLGKY
jgi:hypothetical protein